MSHEQARKDGIGPASFCWLHPGLLGGTPRPGIHNSIAHDLAALQRLGTKLLVSLTGEWQPEAALLAQHGITSLYAPIPDLCPPNLAQADKICAKVQAVINTGHAAVFHCHAGKGRTGTLLAAMLIWAGTPAEAAILQTRAHNKSWIETDSQLEFLHRFAKHRAKSAGDNHQAR